MDAADVGLPLIAAALDSRDRTTFISMLAKATISGHNIDVQVAREGLGYGLYVTAFAADVVVEDVTFTVPRPADELLRLHLVRLWLDTLLVSHARWRARHMPTAITERA
jgi:hypothetical protein